MISARLYLAIVAAVAIERGFELIWSRRNLARAMARGGVERGRNHYRAMVIVHALFLVSAAAEVLLPGRAFPSIVGWTALVMTGAAQSLRYWVVATLGERWNTRVIVIPGAPLVTMGPYRFMRHPNYLAVTIEIAALPMIHGCWMTALLFSLANAVLLSVRIPIEERALGEAPQPDRIPSAVAERGARRVHSR